jgi:hypothetical protein
MMRPTAPAVDRIVLAPAEAGLPGKKRGISGRVGDIHHQGHQEIESIWTRKSRS